MLQKDGLTLAEARRAIDAMLAEAEQEPRRPVAMAVVDAQGDLIAYARMDGVAAMPVRLAHQKAYTAARAGRDTSAFRQRLREQGGNLADYGDPFMAGLPGGVCVLHPRTHRILGGIGVSGHTGERDEAIAQIGRAAMGLT